MQLVIQQPSLPPLRAEIVPGTLFQTDRPADTEADGLAVFRTNQSLAGECEVYFRSGRFSAEDVLNLPLRHGEGSLNFSGAVSVEDALADVTFLAAPPRVRIRWKGTRAS